MCNGTRQIDVRHALATHFCLRNFNATFLADHATMLQPLVFAAETFVVLDRAKNLGAEKAITFWLERSVVNRLRLFNFAKRP